MADARTNRRLAAILAADVVGYSRMMAGDEAGTLAALKRHREAVFNPAVAEHGGRVVKLIGDGTLVEFGSVVDAVTCAVAIQRTIAADTAAGHKITLRIGVNLGDVIVEDDDIYGDGVNIAARLEPLAEPGGICISAIVNDSVGGRIAVRFRNAGEVEVKGIAHPIRVWKWHPTGGDESEPAVSHAERRPLPSLAVLPFQNLGGDAEQDYFADGVVEDLTTALSRFRSFGVIARNSAFVYKGRAVDVRQVARELGCHYVVEGSVRRAGGRLRITAQLIDGATGNHIWAQNFDGAVADIFDVQDRITEGIVALVEPGIQKAEIERSLRKRPESLDAYDLVLRAQQKLNAERPEENAEALALLERAIALEPGYGSALALAANALEHRMTLGWLPLAADDAERTLGYVRKALEVASDDATVLARCGIALLFVGHESGHGIQIVKRAVDMNPNNVRVLFNAGVSLVLGGGDLDEALSYFNRVIRLSPGDTVTAKTGIAHVKMCRGEYEEALVWATRSLAEEPKFAVTRWIIIAANAHLGRLDEAKRALAALMALTPEASLARIRSGNQLKSPQRSAVLLEGLRLAGMPEG